MFSNILEDILIIGACATSNYLGQKKGYQDAMIEVTRQSQEKEILELKKQLLLLQKKSEN